VASYAKRIFELSYDIAVETLGIKAITQLNTNVDQYRVAIHNLSEKIRTTMARIQVMEQKLQTHRQRPARQHYLTAPAARARPIAANRLGANSYLYDVNWKTITEAKHSVLQRAQEEIQKQAAEWVRRAPERAAAEKKEWEEIDAHWAAVDAAQEVNWRYIKTLVGLACSAPDSLSDQARQGNILRAEMDEVALLNHKGGSYLNRCESALIFDMCEQMARSNSVLTSDLVTWAKEYRRAHPSLIDRFKTTLAEFFDALAAEGATASSSHTGKDGHRGGSSSHSHERECFFAPKLGVVACTVN
jgi:hypothetical protein